MDPIHNEDSKYLGNRPVPAADLPAPATPQGWDDLPSQSPMSVPTSGGMIDAIFHTARGIPPCVWVVNLHNEDIIVVVSKYGPSRLISGMGLNASSTGGGLNYDTTTFVSPATQKILSPQSRDPEASSAFFPLWSRRNGFGVISVFLGANRTLFIENDQVPAGATAFFANKPNMKIYDFQGKEIPRSPPAINDSFDL